MGNEQSGRPSGPRYVIALMTEAILPRTDNYILNQISEWAAQQTRPPVACALDTSDRSNGFDEEDDDDVQIIGEDPPRRLGRRQWDNLDLISTDMKPSFESTRDSPLRSPKLKRLAMLPSAKERSRFASYHKPPTMVNMDRGTYLEVLKRKMPNMYRKQAVGGHIFPLTVN